MSSCIVDAALLRTARTRAGWGQRAPATAANTSQSTVAAIETGRKQPTVATLERPTACADLEALLAAEPGPVVSTEPGAMELLAGASAAAPPRLELLVAARSGVALVHRDADDDALSDVVAGLRGRSQVQR